MNKILIASVAVVVIIAALLIYKSQNQLKNMAPNLNYPNLSTQKSDNTNLEAEGVDSELNEIENLMNQSSPDDFDNSGLDVDLSK